MNLIEGLQTEMNRVREIIAEYEQIPGGQFAAAVMEAEIEVAENAIAWGNTVAMVRQLKNLKEYTL